MVDVAKKLIVEINRSSDFTRHNFGMPVGDDFPELCRELLKDDRLAKRIAELWLVDRVMVMGSQLEEMATLGPLGSIRKYPNLAKSFFEFLYWGIRIGRQMEREEKQVLDSIAASQEGRA